MAHDNGHHPTTILEFEGSDARLSVNDGAAYAPAQMHHTAGADSPESTTCSPALSGGWLAGAWALVAGALALAAGGFVNSFSAVRDAVEPSFGDLAWTIPVLIDVGIAVFSGIDLLFTRLDMRLWWLRLVPWTLNGATIWLNTAHEHNSIGVVAHAAPPVLWIVSVELAGHFVRAQAGLHTNPDRPRASGRIDRVGVSRWLMAPWSTLVIRRWMILQQERSFEQAYARWWARKQAKWDMQSSYGVLGWRIRAPRELRGRYRYSHITPTAPATHAAAPQPEPGANRSARPREATRPARRRAPARSRRRAGPDDVRAVVAGLLADGQPVNRTVVTQRLRAEGLSLSNERADRLLADITEDPEPARDRA